MAVAISGRSSPRRTGRLTLTLVVACLVHMVVVATAGPNSCTVTDRSYFTDAPVLQCPYLAECYKTLCSCAGGAFNVTTTSCAYNTAAPPTPAVAQSCVGAAMNCLVGSALALYYPGASPLLLDPCVAWSVYIAQDYLVYYAATTATSSSSSARLATKLVQTCLGAACVIFNDMGVACCDSDSVCSLSSVVSRPTFSPFDPCPFTCADQSCAVDLNSCKCVAKASLGNLSLWPDRPWLLPPEDTSVANASETPAAEVDLTQPITFCATASYRVLQGNCSNADFTYALRYQLSLRLWRNSGIEIDDTSPETVEVSQSNTSCLVIAANTLSRGERYSIQCTVQGLRIGQTWSVRQNFTAQLPPPVAVITQFGTYRKFWNGQDIVISALITDADNVSLPSYAWYCDVVSGGPCPTAAATTVSAYVVPASHSGASSTNGTFLITYAYRSQNRSSVTIEIRSAPSPAVSIVSATQPVLGNMYFCGQVVTFAGVVDAPNVSSYGWILNSASPPEVSQGPIVVLNCSQLIVTSLMEAQASVFRANTLRLVVFSPGFPSSGVAVTNVVVLEQPNMTFTVGNQAGADRVRAVALQDTLMFTVQHSAAPTGVQVRVEFGYYDVVGGAVSLLGLWPSPGPSPGTYFATAPLFSGLGASGVVQFSAVLLYNEVAVGKRIASFNVSKPSADVSATWILQNLPFAKDTGAALAMVGYIGALVVSVSNDTVVQQLSQSALNLLIATVDPSVTLSSGAQAILFWVAAATLSIQTSEVTRKTLSESVQDLIVSQFSRALDRSNEQLAASLVSVLDPTVGDAVSRALARSMALATDIGTARYVSSGGYGFNVARSTVAGLSDWQIGEALVRGSVAFPAYFHVVTLLPTDIVGISAAQIPGNPFDVPRLVGDVLVVDLIFSNYSKVSVRDLSAPIVVTLPAASGTCKYFDETTQRWETRGVETIQGGGFTKCATTHLTAFGSFESASGVYARCAWLAVLLGLLSHIVV